MAALRTSAVMEGRKGLSVRDLILVAVLLAAGAVLKLTVSSFLTFAGMKPNFMIAMYALAIILVRPKVFQAGIIGLITGLISQIPMLNATPLVNIASETLGAVVCGVLVAAFLRVAPNSKALQNALFPALIGFLTTVVSGYTFALIVGCAMNGLGVGVCLATYAVMVFGTAAMNAVVVAVLIPVLRSVLDGKTPYAVKAAPAEEDQPQSQSEEQQAVVVSDKPIVEMRDFSFRYRGGSAETVKNIDLTIMPGTFVGVTGPAGSGKSTLTYALNGIIPHCYPGSFYGAVRIDGHDTCEASLTDISQIVGSVCQDIDSQMVSSVVEDEILYGLENFKVPKNQVEARITEALEDMGIADLRHRAIAGLSGGQKQKVAIASILALRPKVLVLDEPTAELDPASSLGVFRLLRKYARQHGTTVIVVEQKIALLSDFADTLLIMEDGCIRFMGAPEEVLQHSDELLAMGVNCPRATTLTNILREKGYYHGPVCRNVEQAVEACKEVLA